MTLANDQPDPSKDDRDGEKIGNQGLVDEGLDALAATGPLPPVADSVDLTAFDGPNPPSIGQQANSIKPAFSEQVKREAAPEVNRQELLKDLDQIQERGRKQGEEQNVPKQIDILTKLGSSFGSTAANNEFDKSKAEYYLQGAIELAEKKSIQDPQLMLSLYKTAGEFYLHNKTKLGIDNSLVNDLPKAIQYLTKVIDIQRKALPDAAQNQPETIEQHINTLESVADLHQTLGGRDHHAQAVVLLEKARQFRKDNKIPDNLQTALTLQSLGDSYIREGSSRSQAEPKYMEVLEITKALYGADSPQLIPFLDNFDHLNNSELVRKNLEQALKLMESSSQNSSADMLAGRHNHLANLYYAAGNNKNADRHFDQAMSLWRQKPAQGSAEKMADESFKTGNYAGAIDNYLVALGQARKSSSNDRLVIKPEGPSFHTASVCQKLGYAYLKKGDLEKAGNSYDHASKYLTQIQSKYHENAVLPEQIKALSSGLLVESKLQERDEKDPTNRPDDNGSLRMFPERRSKIVDLADKLNILEARVSEGNNAAKSDNYGKDVQAAQAVISALDKAARGSWSTNDYAGAVIALEQVYSIQTAQKMSTESRMETVLTQGHQYFLAGNKEKAIGNCEKAMQLALTEYGKNDPRIGPAFKKSLSDTQMMRCMKTPQMFWIDCTTYRLQKIKALLIELIL